MSTPQPRQGRRRQRNTFVTRGAAPDIPVSERRETPAEPVALLDRGAAGPGSARFRPGAALMRYAWMGQILVVVVLLSLAVWKVGPREIERSFTGVRYEYIAIAVLIYLGSRIVNAWEWQLLLVKVGQAPLFGLLGVLLVGTLVNVVLPGNLGDVAKVQIAANRYALPRAGLVAGRGAEGVINGVMFVVFVLLSVILARSGGGSPGLLWFLVAASAATSVVAVVASRMLPDTLPQWRILRRLPHGIFRGLEIHWPRFHDGFEVIRRPGMFAGLLVLNVFGWTVDILINWSYGSAFNLGVPFSAYVSVAVVLAVITTVPITFGNVGTWEVAVVGVLALYDVPPERALAYALGIHILIASLNIGLGLTAMTMMRIRLRDVFGLGRKPATAIVSVD